MHTTDVTAPTVDLHQLPQPFISLTGSSWTNSAQPDPSWTVQPGAGSVDAPPALADLTDTPLAAGHQTALATGSVIILAALDLAGAYCAMRYAQTGHQAWWSAGAVAFVSLFAVYATCLRWAELGAVTLGWIVLLQVGVVIMDWVANGVTLPAGKIAAIVGILALMAYMLLAPNHSYTPRHAGRPTDTSGGTTVDAARGWNA